MSTRVRNLFDHILSLWRRSRTYILMSLCFAFIFGAASAFLLAARNSRYNHTIAALVRDHDIPVAQSAASKIIFARAYFLMTHRRLDEAQALVGLFDLRGDRPARADLHYDLGNARLLEAFDRIEVGRFDAANALVSLAEDNYIEALRLNPSFWNARYNFDVATRLVRQYPKFISPPDLRSHQPQPLWTELPNVPEGEP